MERVGDMVAPLCRLFLKLLVVAACTPCIGFLFGLGFSLGFAVRVVDHKSAPLSALSAAVSRPRPRELVCTCVPCLPDLFCMKCGHKSRDCPKLAHLFKKGTNLTDSVSK